VFLFGNFKYSRTLSFVGLVTLACLVTSSAEAKGLKERLKRIGGGDKKNGQPVAGISSAPDSEASSDKPNSSRRPVLLVSVPSNKADISEGATIAFIDFRHIEHDFPNTFVGKRTVQTTETQTVSGRRFHQRVEEDGYDSNVCARQVESALAQHLADLNRFKVVTRDHIDTVLEEQHFSNSGSVDSTTAARLGKLIGADVLVYGQVQLCVSSRKDYEKLAKLASMAGSEIDGGKKGWLSNALSAFKELKPEKLRSFVLAQIQLIEAQSGKRIFTSSLAGEFMETRGALAFDMGHRELVYEATDDLANNFIDDLLARQEARYVNLYADNRWDFDQGIDLIQLGDCEQAEMYFRGVYSRYRGSMDERELSKLMYNHGVSLMCANRSEEALARLWASLRLFNDDLTFEAIAFTNDTIDRGRRIMREEDAIIQTVRASRYSYAPSPTAPADSTASDSSE